MIVKQIWTGNAYRNFNYLIACPETGEAIAIDPLDHKKCLEQAKKHNWTITKIINTHEHGDHIGGNGPVVEATGAKIFAHFNAKDKIPNMAKGLLEGDIVTVGKSIELECLNTPGHTMSHVCLLSKTDQPALFCGDTLFNAGAGNCHNGGHPSELYTTFTNQLLKLPDNTLVYPGHDYLENNLEFTIDREPSNYKANTILKQTSGQNLNHPMVSTIGLEKEINTFFRLQNATIINRLRKNFPELSKTPTEKEVFIKLRELRNNW
jgi:hydroxyacylglutathione hydrolase